MITVGYSRLPSGYSGLQQVTAVYRVVTGGYSRLHVTGWLQWVTAGYSLPAVTCCNPLQPLGNLLKPALTHRNHSVTYCTLL